MEYDAEFFMQQRARKAIRSKRLTASGAILCLTGALLINQADYFFRSWQLDGIPLGTSFLLFGSALFVLVYLQSGGPKNVLNERDVVTMVTEIMHGQKALEERITQMKPASEVSAPAIELAQEDRKSAIQTVISTINGDVLDKLFADKSQALQSELKKAAQADIKATARSSVERIRREISDLRLRSNVNLTIGMTITGLGLYLLWTTVALIDTSTLLRTLASEGANANAQFIKNFLLPVVPRITLVIFVEVFAYFFLRLYSAGLMDVKYFQNELTNIESKLIAVEYAIATDHLDSLKISLETLATTERNFILEKNQTTVELERAKFESELSRNVIRTIPDILKKFKSR